MASESPSSSLVASIDCHAAPHFIRPHRQEYEKAHGGDPKWVDKFKLLGSAKEK